MNPMFYPENEKTKGADAARASASGAGACRRNGKSGHKKNNGNAKKTPKVGSSAGVKKKTSAASGNLTKFGTTQEEHVRRRAEGKCFYCGKAHTMADCPESEAGAAGRPSSAGNRPSGPLTFGPRSGSGKRGGNRNSAMLRQNRNF